MYEDVCGSGALSASTICSKRLNHWFKFGGAGCFTGQYPHTCLALALACNMFEHTNSFIHWFKFDAPGCFIGQYTHIYLPPALACNFFEDARSLFPFLCCGMFHWSIPTHSFAPCSRLQIYSKRLVHWSSLMFRDFSLVNPHTHTHLHPAPVWLRLASLPLAPRSRPDGCYLKVDSESS